MNDGKIIQPGKWFCEFDAEGKRTASGYDASYLRLLGYEPKEERYVAYDGWWERIHPDDKPKLSTYFTNVYGKHPEGLDHDIEYRMMTRHGYHWFHDYGRWIRRADGTPARCDGVLFDIQDTVDKVNAHDKLVSFMQRVLALEDNFESMYDVDLGTGEYTLYVNDQTASGNIDTQFTDGLDFFGDALKNNTASVYPDDLDYVNGILNKEYIESHLRDNTSIEYFCRVMIDGAPVWFKTRIAWKDAEKRSVIIGIFNAEAEMAAQRQAEERRHELLNEVLTDEGVFLIDCVNDTRKTFHDSLAGAANYDDTEKYSEGFARYVETFVCGPDKEMMRSFISPQNILKLLGKEKEMKVQYRDRTTGTQRFFQMRITRFSDTEVLQSFRENDAEMVNDLLFTKLKENYFALFGIDLESGLMRSYKSDPLHVAGEEGKISSLSDVMLSLAAKCEGERKAFFERYSDPQQIKERFAKEDRAVMILRSISDPTKWISVTGIVFSRNEDGSPSLFCMAFSNLDEQSGKLQDMREQLGTALEEAKAANARIAEEQLKAGKAEQVRRDQIAKTAGAESTYIVDPSTGRFQILSQNEYLSENYTSDEDFDTSFSRYIESDVFEPDREMVRRSINVPAMVSHLETEDEYIVRYRDISRGVPRWYEMRAVRLSEREILYSFSDKDEEVISRLLYNNFRENYFGWYYVSLDSGLAKIVKTGHPEITGAAGQYVPYSELMKKIASASYDEAAEFFNKISEIDYIRNRFAVEDFAYHVYKSYIFEGSRWVNYTGRVLRRHEDGTPAAFALALSLLDEEARAKEEANLRLKETLTFTNLFLDPYDSAYYIGLDDLSWRVYKRPDIIHNSYPLEEDYVSSFGRYIQTEVHPDDREALSLLVDPVRLKQKLSEEAQFDINFRKISEKEDKYFRCSVMRGGDGSHAAFGFRNITAEVLRQQEEEIRKQQLREQEILSEQFINTFVDAYDIAYKVNMSDDSYSLLKKSEDMVGKDIVFKDFSQAVNYMIDTLVFEPDRERVRRELGNEEVRRKLTESPTFTIEYRILVDGVTRWDDMTVRLLDDRNLAVGFVVNNEGIIRSHLLEKEYEDYYALFSIDLDTEQMTTLKNDSDHSIGAVGAAVPYAAAMKNYAETLDDEGKEFFIRKSDIENLKADHRHDDKLTFVYQAGSGEEKRWIRLTSYVIIRRDDGTPSVMALGFNFMDAMGVDRQEMRRQLREALDMAESSNRAKSTFLFNMSHDIRTPMNAILGFTGMAQKYLGNTEKVADYLGKIDSSGKQLLELINEVLEMSRIESGRMEIREDPVNIAEQFNASVTVLAEQATAKGLEFHYSLSDAVHTNVFADTAKMSSITLNITGNAMKYTPRGGRIDFSLREVPARKPDCATFVFTVADTGIGMSEEYLKELYEPFSREKSTTVSHIQGTGLGMSIVKNLVDLLGGNIEVRSEVGKGTRFDITVDFRINEAAEKKAKGAQRQKSFSFDGGKALVVEDNELNRDIIADILEEEHFAVETAADGSVAVEMLREKGPEYYDFILMDIQMPVMNGYEATRAIRAMYPEKHIPIIAVSANAFAEDRAESLAVGMDDHVAKPINIGELFGALAKFL